MIADPVADIMEAKRLYGVSFAELSSIRDMDAVILAVAHDAFAGLTMADIGRLFQADMPNGAKVLMDIKGIMDRGKYEAAGYRYWRL